MANKPGIMDRGRTKVILAKLSRCLSGCFGLLIGVSPIACEQAPRVDEAKTHLDVEIRDEDGEKERQSDVDSTIDGETPSEQWAHNGLAKGGREAQPRIADKQEENIIRIAKQEIESTVSWANNAEYRAVRHRQGGWRVTAMEVSGYDAKGDVVYGGAHYFVYIDDMGNVTKTSKGR